MKQDVKSMLCIEVSEELKRSLDIYIYGTDKAAAGLFFQLCSWHIPVKGFVSEGYDEVGMFFHKPIFAVKELQKQATIVTPHEKIKKWENCITSENVIGINRKINRKSLVIYGCGKVGRQLKKYLETIDVNVKCFIETNSEKIGTEVDGLPIYGKEKLETLGDDTSVIAAGQCWKEIDNIIRRTNAKLDRYYLPNCVFLDYISMAPNYGGGGNCRLRKKYKDWVF